MRIPISEGDLGYIHSSGKYGAFFYPVNSSYGVNFLEKYKSGLRTCLYSEFKKLYPYLSKFSYYNYRLKQKE